VSQVPVSQFLTSQPLQDGTHCLPVAVTFPWECKEDSSVFLSNTRARVLGGQQSRDLLGVPPVAAGRSADAARFKLLGDGL
jgi:hypothetical protein